jgi:hypothetical protein
MAPPLNIASRAYATQKAPEPLTKFTQMHWQGNVLRATDRGGAGGMVD